MGVLRWWFTLNYDAVSASAHRRAFALCGQGVKVESENEHLTAPGKRVDTGQSEGAERGSSPAVSPPISTPSLKIPHLCRAAQLFDLGLACAWADEEGLADRVGWHLTCFGNPQAFAVEMGEAPRRFRPW